MCCSKTVDAEDHYKKKVVRLKKQIGREIRIQDKRNIGTAFLMFSDARIVKDLRYMSREFFKPRIA
jgi:hypothetical protein